MVLKKSQTEAGEKARKVMANSDFPSFTEEHFEEIGGSPEGKYIAFLFDPDDKAVGTLRGNNLIHLTDHLKENALKNKKKAHTNRGIIRQCANCIKSKVKLKTKK